MVDGWHVYETIISAFTPGHITALQESSAQLQTLHISDHSLQQVSSLAPSMADIARFASLTKLHLTLTALGTAVDFHPLAHLSLLSDLALQCPILMDGVKRTCNGVLSSSKQSLHHVILTTGVWDVDTYRGVRACSQLKSVCIRVWQLSTAEAEQLGGVQADSIQLTLLTPYRLQADTFQALTASVPRIRELTCRDIPHPLGSYLQRLSTLETLHLLTAKEVLSMGLQPQMSVKNLNLYGQEVLYREKVRNLMRAFPCLSWIRIDKLCGTDAQSLEALAAGAHLTFISLVDFYGITDEHISHVHWAFYRQQALGKAEPLVKVCLRTKFDVKAPIDLLSHIPMAVFGSVPASWCAKAAVSRGPTVEFRKGVEPLPGQKYINCYERWCQ